ncbi:MAG: type IV pilus modification protein PilV [Rudaea sp.]|nr:type IV pilus modification protein PilV [Rudaea sp.]
MSRCSDRGFTLLEVLIALLVFSLGLIGLAGLLTVSVRTNHSAYLRTQAIFLAQGMADRMSANPLGVWGGKYTLNAIVAPGSSATAAANTAGASTQCTTGACAYAAVATRDLQVWQNQLNNFLPNAGAAIVCQAPAAAPSALQLLTLPPYSTTCEMEITWTELQIPSSNNPPELFDWVFQP